MKIATMKTQLVGIAIVVASVMAMAESTILVVESKPFNMSLSPDAALFERSVRINGLTLSVWGENPQTSLAFGLVNGSILDSAGVSLGILNYAENYMGLQWGLVNYTKQESSGWGGGFFGVVISGVNYAGTSMKGLYTGVVNYTGKLTGLHFGLVNYAGDASGVQIGLFNVIGSNKTWFSDMPHQFAPAMFLVNWRF